MAYTTASLVEVPTLTNGVLRVLWEIAGDKVEPQRFSDEFTFAPDLGTIGQRHIDRLNGLAALAALGTGPVALPILAPPVEDATQIAKAVYISAYQKYQSTVKAFAAGVVTQSVVDTAAVALKTAYRPGFETLTGG
jgi:hypothetical protein